MGTAVAALATVAAAAVVVAAVLATTASAIPKRCSGHDVNGPRSGPYCRSHTSIQPSIQSSVHPSTQPYIRLPKPPLSLSPRNTQTAIAESLQESNRWRRVPHQRNRHRRVAHRGHPPLLRRSLGATKRISDALKGESTKRRSTEE
eukprot:365756-Chlamydomonas_euryale.AAC.16